MKTKIMRFSKFMLAVLLVTGSNFASAVLISVDDPVFGVGSLTQDDVAGLEWLDVSDTKGLSVNQVLAGSNGYLAAGLRYASEAEVSALYLELGFPTVGDGFHVAGPGAAGQLAVTLLGQTTMDSAGNAIISANYLDGTDYQIGRMLTAAIGGTPFQGASVGVNFSAVGRSSSLSGVGHYLVRSFAVEVSEPTTLALMGLGLAGLGIARCKRRRSSPLR